MTAEYEITVESVRALAAKVLMTQVYSSNKRQDTLRQGIESKLEEPNRFNQNY